MIDLELFNLDVLHDIFMFLGISSDKRPTYILLGIEEEDCDFTIDVQVSKHDHPNEYRLVWYIKGSFTIGGSEDKHVTTIKEIIDVYNTHYYDR